jgi:6-phosphogluconolactonase (cycloisomerase 2 family)
VYLDANDTRPGRNAVIGYRRQADGTLSPLPGSPYLTGGTGAGDNQSGVGVEDSSQDIIVNDDHTLLFAVNAGSDSIAVFHIEPDGSLTPVPGSPFASGGVEPVSLGLSGDRLYVAHKDLDPARDPALASPGYTGFRVAGDGRLEPIPFSTVAAPAFSAPSQALVSPDGRFLFDAQTLAGSVAAMRIEPSGRLAPVSSVQVPIPGVLPLGLAAHPTSPIVYAGFATATQVGVFRYDEATGATSFVQAAGTSGVAPCWLAIDRAGHNLYSINPGDRSVSRLGLADPLSPVELQHVVLHPAGATGFPFQTALDTEGRHLYVVSQQSFVFDPADAAANALHVLHVEDDGSIVEIPSSPVSLPIPFDTRAQGVVAL